MMSRRRCSPTSIGRFACILCAAIVAGHAVAAPVVPANFRVENAVNRVTFELPTCLAFFPDGALLVGEKRGRAYVVRGGVRSPAPAWSHEREVLNVGDLGLMSVAVDPRFATNRCVYFLYNVDPDSNGVDTEPNSFGRLTRYRMSTSDSNVVFLGWIDGELDSGLRQRWEVCHWIRTFMPDVVLGHDPWRRYRIHPDHRHAGLLACEGIVAARDPKFFPEQHAAPHRPSALLLWEADEVNHVETCDQTAVDLKVTALLQHESQYETTMRIAADPKVSSDNDALNEFRATVFEEARNAGRLANRETGEAFALLTSL